jgi:LmbE family N-acetylglucosaminyl deacetylase
MKLDFTDERVLAVVAHPDDAELLCAGTLARARDDGATIGIAVMCKGDGGQPVKPIPNLTQLRRKEMNTAGKLLGAKVFHGAAGDGKLFDTTAARQRLMDIFRVFKPTLVITHDPADYHADHQATSKIAETASWLCASSGQKTKRKALGVQPKLWFMDTINMSGFLPGFYVDVTDYMDVKEKMLACHKSQIARGSDDNMPAVIELLRLQAAARGEQADVAAAEAFRIAPLMKRVDAW